MRSCPVRPLRTISKGNSFAEYYSKGNNSKIRSSMIKRMVLEAGFRVEIQKTESGHLIKIFGDG